MKLKDKNEILFSLSLRVSLILSNYVGYFWDWKCIYETQSNNKLMTMNHVRK